MGPRRRARHPVTNSALCYGRCSLLQGLSAQPLNTRCPCAAATASHPGQRHCSSSDFVGRWMFLLACCAAKRNLATASESAAPRSPNSHACDLVYFAEQPTRNDRVNGRHSPMSPSEFDGCYLPRSPLDTLRVITWDMHGYFCRCGIMWPYSRRSFVPGRSRLEYKSVSTP